MNEIEFYTPIILRFLKDWEGELEGCDYGVEFNFRAKDIKNRNFGPVSILKQLLPSYQNIHATIEPVHSNRVSDKILKCVLYLDSLGHHPRHYTKGIVDSTKKQRIPKLEAHIRNFVTINNSDVYICENVPEFPSIDIIWRFCFLFVDRTRSRAVMLSGGASD